MENKKLSNLASGKAKTKTYGIGNVTANKIRGIAFLHPSVKYSNIKASQDRIDVKKLDSRVGFQARYKQFKNEISKMKNGTYVGIRRIQGLPARGQRTHTNANTPAKLYNLGKSFSFPIKKRKAFLNKKTTNKKTLGNKGKGKQILSKKPNAKNKKKK